MPAKLKNQMITCEFFRWKLYQRKGVFMADGRSNRINLGRHSLGTRDKEQAKKELVQLDLTMAVHNGLANKARLEGSDSVGFPLDQAFALFLQDRSNPRVAGGVSRSTLQNYDKWWKKFQEFAQEKRIHHLGQISKELLNQYSCWLDAKGMAPKYIRDLLCFVLRLINWLIEANHLTPDRKITLKMKNYESEEAYCYTAGEFQAMLEYATDHQNPRVRQVGEMIRVLGYTGLRINELLQLQWHNIHLDERFITVKDDSSKPSTVVGRQSTKSARTRRIPIHKDLLEWLQTKQGKQSGRLFENLDGGPLTYSSALEAFKKVRSALVARLPGREGEKSFRNGCFHSLRHFFCSRHAQQGVPEMTMCKWLGHHSSRITRRYYHNNDPESLRLIDAVNVLGSSNQAGKSPAKTRKNLVVGGSKDRRVTGMKRRRKTG